MSLQLISAPEALPLDWESEVKSHLRLDTEDERARVEATNIPAVLEWAEAFTQRALTTQTWRLFRDAFPAPLEPIEIPRPPLQSITHVKYYDPDGVQQTWDPANYETDPPIASPAVFDPHCQPYRLWPVNGQSYPGTAARRNAVEVEFVCGYGDESQAVPGKLRQAMLLRLGADFETREDVASKFMTVADRLAWPFRVRLFSGAA